MITESRPISVLRRVLIWGGVTILSKHVRQFPVIEMLNADDIGIGWVMTNTEWMLFERDDALVKIKRKLTVERIDYDAYTNKQFKEKYGFYKEAHFDHYHKFHKALKTLQQYYV
jgi:hypothetical protein